MNVLEIAIRATNAALAVTSKKPEVVSRCERKDDGWLAVVDVLEQKAMIADNDVIATYQLLFDNEGELVGYERVRRYQRGNINGQFAA